eukprot:jgi/Mesvir1/26438/Mv16123-RA.3
MAAIAYSQVNAVTPNPYCLKNVPGRCNSNSTNRTHFAQRLAIAGECLVIPTSKARRNLSRKQGSVSRIEATINAEDLRVQPATAQQQPGPQSETTVFQSVLSGKRASGTRITVENLTKDFQSKYGVFRAVDDVSVEFKAGDLVALLGPSGSGKSTLLRLLAGLEMPSSGRILFDGQDMTRVRVQDRQVGMMFQNYALFRHMDVAGNIGFGLRMKKQPQAVIDERVKELLQLVQLPHVGERFPPQLSGGQRQRIALARALAGEPRVLLLDEPFGALDSLVRKDLRSWLRTLHRQLGLTTVFVTHDQEEAMEVADTIVIFNKGKIAQMGTPRDLWEKPNSPLVMNFLGQVCSLPTNCRAVRTSGFRSDKSMVEYEVRFDDGYELALRIPRPDHDSNPFEATQRVYVELDPALMQGYNLEDLS